MRLREEIKNLYKDLRISIREISLSSPIENRIDAKDLLTFTVTYQIIGKRKEKVPGLISPYTVLKESTHVANIGLFELDKEQQNELYDAMFLLKRLMESEIAKWEEMDSEALRWEKENSGKGKQKAST